MPARALVTVVRKSYDDETAPPAAYFASVDGTVGGVVRANGKAVHAVAVGKVSHTFIVAGLDLNVPVPAVTSKARFVIETFGFVTGAAATWERQCCAPCGTGKTGGDEAVVTPGDMMGHWWSARLSSR